MNTLTFLPKDLVFESLIYNNKKINYQRRICVKKIGYFISKIIF